MLVMVGILIVIWLGLHMATDGIFLTARNLYNLTARIESQCKALNQPVLLSAAFAGCDPDRSVSLGRHQLKGIDEPQEIFALREPG